MRRFPWRPRFTTRPRSDLVTVPLTDVRAVRSIVAIGRPDRIERGAVRVVLESLREIAASLR